MKFADKVKEFAQRIENLSETIKSEEATKTSIIMPFFSMLGYDVFNPNEFMPEFTADVGIKKGEKVDFAILVDKKPVMLIEAKPLGTKLKKYANQLYRYFSATPAKIAILTDGRYYKFYSDIDEENIMDEKPFLDIDILNIKDEQIIELERFCKEKFSVKDILGIASELKYIQDFKEQIKIEFENPSDELVKLFLKNSYTGAKTKNVVEKFRPTIKKAISLYQAELLGDKISISESMIQDLERIEELERIEKETKQPQHPPVINDILSHFSHLNLNYEQNDSVYIFSQNGTGEIKFLYRNYKGQDQLFLKDSFGFYQRYYIDTQEAIEEIKSIM